MEARFPKGIRKVIDLYRDRVEAVAGGWVDWENPLGCGAFGCVFQLWSQDVGFDRPDSQAYPLNRVLKISTDPTEGPVVSAIMKTGLDDQLAGLARWYGVWRVPEKIQKGRRSTAWIIVREAVKPFDWMGHLRETGTTFQWIGILQNYNIHAARERDLKRPWMKRMARENADRELVKLYDFPPTYYVAYAIEQLRHRGILLADVHAANLGMRLEDTSNQEVQIVRWADGVERPALLIFDPGHSMAPPGTAVEDLWQTSEALNPWMGGERREIAVL